MKTATKVVLGAAILGAVIGVASVPSPGGSTVSQAAAEAKPSDKVASAVPEAAASSPSDPEKDYVAQLERETETLTKDFDISKFGDGQDAIFLAVAAFKLEARLYYDGNQYELTPKQQHVRERFERALMAAQRRAFPKLRKAWVRQASDKLWEHDIEVRALGSRSDVIEFTGGMFAANANIKVMQEKLLDSFQTLRFRQSRFAWVHSAGYTYWDIDSSKDDALLAPTDTDLASSTN